MDDKNKPSGNEQAEAQQQVPNPFENSQPVEKDIAQNQEKLDSEQQFKEASTERD